MLARVWSGENPSGVFVAWDTLGIDTYRSELWPPYQGGRVFDKELIDQLDLLPPLCEGFALGVGKAAGFEADDFMASACRAECEAGGNCLVLTTDRDSYQLVSDRVTILVPKRGSRELHRVGPEEVAREMGVLPEQIPDFKALSGDSSDCIPGIKGIGPKSAASLLLQYGTLEGVLENWSRPEDIPLALKFREVTRMNGALPVTLPAGPPDWAAGAEALTLLGANALAERLGQIST